MRRWVGVAVALGAAVGLRSFVAAPYRVPSDSMAETLMEGDYVWVNRLARVRPGDVVVFRRGDAWHVKRLVAIEGQTVAWQGGRIEVDGVAAAPSPSALLPWQAACANGRTPRFIATAAASTRLAGSCDLHLDSTGADGSVRVARGDAFVVGDHRTASEDSRTYGPIPAEAIVGRVAGIYLSRDPRSGAWRWARVGALK